MAPRDLNEPPSLEPSLNAGGPLTEHIDNNNLNNPNNPPGFTNIAAAAGQKTGSDIGSDVTTSNGPSNPTVSVTGDLTGTQSVTPETEVMDALYKIDPNFKDYDYTRVDGSTVDLTSPVKGDLNLIAKKSAKAGTTSGTQSGGTGTNTGAPK